MFSYLVFLIPNCIFSFSLIYHCCKTFSIPFILALMWTVVVPSTTSTTSFKWRQMKVETKTISSIFVYSQVKTLSVNDERCEWCIYLQLHFPTVKLYKFVYFFSHRSVKYMEAYFLCVIHVYYLANCNIHTTTIVV